MSERFALLKQFIEQRLAPTAEDLEMVSGDASFRRYYRLTRTTPPLILMDAPPSHEDVAKFVRLDLAFAAAGLRVPQIIAQDLERGFLALEDLGDRTLSHLLGGDATPWYRAALALLPAVRRVSQQTALPLFDAAFIQRELGIFTQWFVQEHLGKSLDAALQQLLDETFQVIEHNLLLQPVAGMHRDFHSRNLMVLADETLVTIDFQDAVVGPVCYDAVSLLRDCYVRWPEAEVVAWSRDFYQQLQGEGYYQAGFAAFQRDFDIVGLQRHIKVLGIFCRLNYRDGKSGYMADLPRVYGYVVDVANRYRELQPFANWLASIVPSEWQEQRA